MIRQANKSDLVIIAKLIEIGSEGGQVLLRSLEELSQALPSFFVYLEGDKIVGCCAIDIYNKKLAEVRSLAVLPQYQKLGIGSKLVQRCLEEAKHQGIYEVLAVTSHHKMFETIGFSTELSNSKKPLLIKL